jgi:glycosyltransferase involved in cell wall biosynthesis
VEVRALVVDDGSLDDTPVVGRDIAASDSRVQYRRHDVNKGHIATYNEGIIGWASADYTVLLSADDLLTPGSLRRAVDLMERERSIGMVYGRSIQFREEAELPRVDDGGCRYRCFSGIDWLERRCRAGYNVIASPEVVVRTSIQREVGGYSRELPHAGDFDMWMKIAAVSGIGYVQRAPQAFYRLHSSSMLRTNYSKSILDLRQRKAAYDSVFENYGHRIPNSARLHSMAMRALAREALWDACRAYDHNLVVERGAEELIAFAMNACQDAAKLPEYVGLNRRRRLGPVLCNRTQVFIGAAIAKHAQKLLQNYYWQHYGV